MRRLAGRGLVFVLLVLAGPGWPPVLAAGEAARVTAVTPAVRGGRLVCTVATTGLPGERIASSVRSGLVSSVDFYLDLVRADDGSRVASSRISFQLAFDLWDEIFSVHTDSSTVYLADLRELADYLAVLPGMPVATLDDLTGLDPQRQLVLLVDLDLEPIADPDRQRVEDIIAGSATTGQGGQEAKVDLGRLIRFFYKDRRKTAAGGDGGGGPFISLPFRLKELPNVPD